MLLKEKCQKCHKDVTLVSSARLGATLLKSYSCGHLFADTIKTKHESFISSIEPFVASFVDEAFEFDRFCDDGGCQFVDFIPESFYSVDRTQCAYEFQRDGVLFIEENGLSCLIADEMGLGKTVQALLAIKRSGKKALICAKGSTIFQWAKMAQKWLSSNPLAVMPIVNRNCIVAGFEAYVISIDLLSRKGVLDKLATLGIEVIIIDECQNFKDANSNRTKALITFIQDNEIKHRIPMSGTPIKNRANEYFVMLNLLHPEIFSSYPRFCRQWLIPNEKGIYTELDPNLLSRFHEVTSKWIIRRRVKDVQKNLPPLTRDFQFMEIEDPLLKNAYNKELYMFQNFLDIAVRVDSVSILGWLAKMRKITGQAKIPWAKEYAEQFMEQTEDSLVLGIHHHVVRDVLYYALEKYNPLKFSGEDSALDKERIKQEFMDKKTRLMIMNIIAGGTGTDGLQHVCHNFVTLERQWSSADEEQFEKRFIRDGQKYPCSGIYPVANGTIDEFFHTKVEEKRRILRDTLGDEAAENYSIEADDNLLRDLAEMTVRNKLK